MKADSLHSSPDFGVLCCFIATFGESAGLGIVNTKELAKAIVNQTEVPKLLSELITKLLKRAKRTFATGKWEPAVVRVSQVYSVPDAVQFETHGFAGANVGAKVRLLKYLVEAVFDMPGANIRAELNKLGPEGLRFEPVGRDSHGRTYWYIVDKDCNIWLYREDEDDEKWELVADDRESVMKVIESLETGTTDPEKVPPSETVTPDDTQDDTEFKKRAENSQLLDAIPETQAENGENGRRDNPASFSEHSSDGNSQEKLEIDEDIVGEEMEEPTVVAEGPGKGREPESGNQNADGEEESKAGDGAETRNEGDAPADTGTEPPASDSSGAENSVADTRLNCSDNVLTSPEPNSTEETRTGASVTIPTEMQGYVSQSVCTESQPSEPPPQPRVTGAATELITTESGAQEKLENSGKKPNESLDASVVSEVDGLAQLVPADLSKDPAKNQHPEEAIFPDEPTSQQILGIATPELDKSMAGKDSSVGLSAEPTSSIYMNLGDAENQRQDESSYENGVTSTEFIQPVDKAASSELGLLEAEIASKDIGQSREEPHTNVSGEILESGHTEAIGQSLPSSESVQSVLGIFESASQSSVENSSLKEPLASHAGDSSVPTHDSLRIGESATVQVEPREKKQSVDLQGSRVQTSTGSVQTEIRDKLSNSKDKLETSLSVLEAVQDPVEQAVSESLGITDVKGGAEVTQLKVLSGTATNQNRDASVGVQGRTEVTLPLPEVSVEALEGVKVKGGDVNRLAREDPLLHKTSIDSGLSESSGDLSQSPDKPLLPIDVHTAGEVEHPNVNLASYNDGSSHSSGLQDTSLTPSKSEAVTAVEKPPVNNIRRASNEISGQDKVLDGSVASLREKVVDDTQNQLVRKDELTKTSDDGQEVKTGDVTDKGVKVLGKERIEDDLGRSRKDSELEITKGVDLGKSKEGQTLGNYVAPFGARQVSRGEPDPLNIETGRKERGNRKEGCCDEAQSEDKSESGRTGVEKSETLGSGKLGIVGHVSGILSSDKKLASNKLVNTQSENSVLVNNSPADHATSVVQKLPDTPVKTELVTPEIGNDPNGERAESAISASEDSPSDASAAEEPKKPFLKIRSDLIAPAPKPKPKVGPASKTGRKIVTPTAKVSSASNQPPLPLPPIMMIETPRNVNISVYGDPQPRRLPRNPLGKGASPSGDPLKRVPNKGSLPPVPKGVTISPVAKTPLTATPVTTKPITTQRRTVTKGANQTAISPTVPKVANKTAVTPVKGLMKTVSETSVTPSPIATSKKAATPPKPKTPVKAARKTPIKKALTPDTSKTVKGTTPGSKLAGSANVRRKPLGSVVLPTETIVEDSTVTLKTVERNTLVIAPGKCEEGPDESGTANSSTTEEVNTVGTDSTAVQEPVVPKKAPMILKLNKPKPRAKTEEFKITSNFQDAFANQIKKKTKEVTPGGAAPAKTPVEKRKRGRPSKVKKESSDSEDPPSPDPDEDTPGRRRSVPMRQSSRIAVLRMKETDEREHEDEHVKKRPVEEDKERHKKKMEKETKKTEKLVEPPKEDKKGKKKRHHSGSSSGFSEEIDNLEQERAYELLFKSDHEFSCDSDIEKGDEGGKLKLARTAEIVEEDTDTTDNPCHRCLKSDHPEWILLCDQCDLGWHASCLKPALLVIPEGDWYCPGCSHVRLVESLRRRLVEYDQLLIERDERHKQVALAKKRAADAAAQQLLEEVDREVSLRRKSTSASSSEESESDSESESQEEDEPIRPRKRAAAQHGSYSMKDYDEIFKSALGEDDRPGPIDAGKPRPPTPSDEKEEENEKPEKEQPTDYAPVSKAAKVKKVQTSDSESEVDLRPSKLIKNKVAKKKNQKRRSIRDLSGTSQSDDASDDDFKVSEEAESEESDASLKRADSDVPSDFSGFGHRGKKKNKKEKRKSKKVGGKSLRRSVRTSKRYYQEESDSESGFELPVKKKKKRNSSSSSGSVSGSESGSGDSSNSGWKKKQAKKKTNWSASKKQPPSKKKAPPPSKSSKRSRIATDSSDQSENEADPEMPVLEKEADAVEGEAAEVAEDTEKPKDVLVEKPKPKRGKAREVSPVPLDDEPVSRRQTRGKVGLYRMDLMDAEYDSEEEKTKKWMRKFTHPNKASESSDDEDKAPKKKARPVPVRKPAAKKQKIESPPKPAETEVQPPPSATNENSNISEAASESNDTTATVDMLSPTKLVLHINRNKTPKKSPAPKKLVIETPKESHLSETPKKLEVTETPKKLEVTETPKKSEVTETPISSEPEIPAIPKEVVAHVAVAEIKEQGEPLVPTTVAAVEVTPSKNVEDAVGRFSFTPMTTPESAGKKRGRPAKPLIPLPDGSLPKKRGRKSKAQNQAENYAVAPSSPSHTPVDPPPVGAQLDQNPYLDQVPIKPTSSSTLSLQEMVDKLGGQKEGEKPPNQEDVSNEAPPPRPPSEHAYEQHLPPGFMRFNGPRPELRYPFPFDPSKMSHPDQMRGMRPFPTEMMMRPPFDRFNQPGQPRPPPSHNLDVRPPMSEGMGQHHYDPRVLEMMSRLPFPPRPPVSQSGPYRPEAIHRPPFGHPMSGHQQPQGPPGQHSFGPQNSETVRPPTSHAPSSEPRNAIAPPQQSPSGSPGGQQAFEPRNREMVARPTTSPASGFDLRNPGVPPQPSPTGPSGGQQAFDPRNRDMILRPPVSQPSSFDPRSDPLSAVDRSGPPARHSAQHRFDARTPEVVVQPPTSQPSMFDPRNQPAQQQNPQEAVDGRGPPSGQSGRHSFDARNLEMERPPTSQPSGFDPRSAGLYPTDLRRQDAGVRPPSELPRGNQPPSLDSGRPSGHPRPSDQNGPPLSHPTNTSPDTNLPPQNSGSRVHEMRSPASGQHSDHIKPPFGSPGLRHSAEGGYRPFFPHGMSPFERPPYRLPSVLERTQPSAPDSPEKARSSDLTQTEGGRPPAPPSEIPQSLQDSRPPPEYFRSTTSEMPRGQGGLQALPEGLRGYPPEFMRQPFMSSERMRGHVQGASPIQQEREEGRPRQPESPDRRGPSANRSSGSPGRSAESNRPSDPNVIRYSLPPEYLRNLPFDYTNPLFFPKPAEGPRPGTPPAARRPVEQNPEKKSYPENLTKPENHENPAFMPQRVEPIRPHFPSVPEASRTTPPMPSGSESPRSGGPPPRYPSYMIPPNYQQFVNRGPYPGMFPPGYPPYEPMGQAHMERVPRPQQAAMQVVDDERQIFRVERSPEDPSEGSDREGSKDGEFGGLVSYFSSQHEDME